MLRRLAGIIPEVLSLAVGFDVLSLPRSYHTGLVATFRDRAGLEAYTVHPEHVKVADYGRGISEHVASVDFEDEG
jgi:Stress responsive A/B Barrel Domain